MFANLSWLVHVCLLYVDTSSLCQKNVQAGQKWTLTLKVCDPAYADWITGVSPAERWGLKPVGLSD